MQSTLLAKLRKSAAHGSTRNLNQPLERRVHLQDQEDRSSNRERAQEQRNHDGSIAGREKAEATSEPRTRAVIVPTRPIPRFTIFFDSALRCCSGKRVLRNIPNSAPPKQHANTIKPMAIEFMIAAAYKDRLPGSMVRTFIAFCCLIMGEREE
jgi:hypothetical protein